MHVSIDLFFVQPADIPLVTAVYVCLTGELPWLMSKKSSRWKRLLFLEGMKSISHWIPLRKGGRDSSISVTLFMSGVLNSISRRNGPLMWLKRIFERFSEQAKAVVPVPENRQAVRSYLEVPIVFHGSKGKVEATSFDINTQGLFVRTTQLPEPGVRRKAELTLPGGPVIACTLQVVWVNDYGSSAVVINRPPGFGAIFTEITEGDRSLIQDAVNNHLI